MLKKEPKQLSFYSILFDRIPEKHILKLIDNGVDFSFINVYLEKSYCKYYGRPAKEPEMMMKLLFLQYLYNLSDVQVINETKVNLAYMWFVGINPDEELPDPSLLAKFRRHRLSGITLDDMITEIVRQCVDRDIIKGTGISVDCTHTHANTKKKTPERLMKHLAKKIFKELNKENGSIPEGVNQNIPDYKKIENHEQAKKTMKDYLEGVISEVKTEVDISTLEETKAVIEKAEEILESTKFMEQKGVRSLVDEDARVGNKSKTENFFGYKVEFAMVPEERIITAMDVHDGAYVDGNDYKKLYDNTKESGLNIKEAYGDKGYFRKPILDLLEKEKVEAIIPVSESVYRLDESKYRYNKDSDQWFCEYENYTVSKQTKTRKDGRKFLEYKFEREICRNCPNRGNCIKGNSIAKNLSIGINTPEFYEYNQKTKTDEFLEKYKKRASHEWKNGEMKRFHGLDRARGYGLRSIEIQAKITAIVVNLKRIASLLSSNLNIFYSIKGKSNLLTNRYQILVFNGF